MRIFPFISPPVTRPMPVLLHWRYSEAHARGVIVADDGRPPRLDGCVNYRLSERFHASVYGGDQRCVVNRSVSATYHARGSFDPVAEGRRWANDDYKRLRGPWAGDLEAAHLLAGLRNNMSPQATAIATLIQQAASVRWSERAWVRDQLERIGMAREGALKAARDVAARATHIYRQATAVVGLVILDGGDKYDAAKASALAKADEWMYAMRVACKP